MLQLFENLLINLGFNVGGLPDLLLAAILIIGLIIVVRVLYEAADVLLSIGCTVIAAIIIIWVLIELFTG